MEKSTVELDSSAKRGERSRRRKELRVRRQFERTADASAIAFVESPIKKMLLKELIEAHEKEREEKSVGNLVEKVDSSKKTKTTTTTPKKKKKKIERSTHVENELDDEEDDDAAVDEFNRAVLRKYRAVPQFLGTNPDSSRRRAVEVRFSPRVSNAHSPFFFLFSSSLFLTCPKGSIFSWSKSAF